MEFSEIKKIERKPFDEDWITSFYEAYMNNWISGSGSIIFMLICRYLEKFGEIYDFDMELLDSKYFFITQNLESLELQEDLTDILLQLIESNESLFARIAERCGFQIVCFPTNTDFIKPEIWDKTEKEQRSFLRTFFEGLDKAWYPFIFENLETIKGSNQYMEEGAVYIMRNETLGLYRQLCQKHKSLIESNLFDEKREIDAAILDIKYPLHYYNYNVDGYVKDNYYICFDIGFNGCNYLDFTYLNYNWILTGFVLEKLLTDFKGKLKQLLEVEQYRKEVS